MSDCTLVVALVTMIAAMRCGSRAFIPVALWSTTNHHRSVEEKGRSYTASALATSVV